MRHLRVLIVILALVPLCALSAYADGIWVVNQGAPSVTSYLITDTGNVTPQTNITGGSTGFASTGSGVTGICIDPTHTYLWVTDQTNNKLSRFNLTDTGNVAPGVTISGASTTLNRPASCYFNSSGDIWVTNINTNSVLRWSAAHLVAGGNVAPDTTFTASDMSLPGANSVDGSGNIYVGQFGSSACVSANCFGYLFPSTASGSTVPTAKWSWAGLDHILGIGKGAGKLFMASDSFNTCAATGGSDGGVAIYNAPASSSSSAPDRQICGPTALPGTVAGLAVDANGSVIVLVSSGNYLAVFDAGIGGNVAPNQKIQGASTQLNNPVGVAIIGNFPTVSTGAIWPFP